MKKFEVLLVNLPPQALNLENINKNDNDNISVSHSFPPLGLFSLANSIYKKNYIKGVKCLDFALYDYSGISCANEYIEFIKNKMKGYIELRKPDIVCVSLMFAASYEFFELAIKSIVELLDDSLIICGGMHATSCASFILNDNPHIDYIICGEGEEALPDLLYNLSESINEDIVGVHSKQNIKYMSNGKLETATVVEGLNIDFEIYPDIFDMDSYTNNTFLFSLSKTTIEAKSFSIMASRGCPVSCIFCASHTVHGRKPRWRDIDNIVNEIFWLYKNYGVTKIYLMDDNFVPKSKAVELFNALAQINVPNLEIVIQNLSVNHTDYDIIDAIILAKITSIAFAIETGSSEMQKKIKKFCNLEKAIDIVKYSQNKGLNVRCFFILGFPGETVEQMQETIDFAIKVGADWSTFNVAMPIPGTEMYSEFLELGYIEDSPKFWEIETIRDRLFDTPEIKAADIKDMAFLANIKINFINNPQILRGEFEKANTIFTNFVTKVEFHIFGYDCLRRIYKLSGDNENEMKMLKYMKELITTNSKSKSFIKYLYLLDDDVREFLI